MRFWNSILLVAVLLGSPAFAASRSATHSGARPNDAEIEQSIRVKLAKSKIGKDGFQVRVKNGVVTWEGHTNVPQHKGAATRMAHTAGAIQVVNNIHIDGGAGVGHPLHKAEVKTE